MGLMNMCLSATAGQPVENMEEILLHKLLHIFVLNEYLFLFYQDAVVGGALSVEGTRMTERINGKDDVLIYRILPNVLMHRTELVRYNGMRQARSYYEVTLPTVRQVVRNQFTCQALTGARLDNQPTNPNSCFGAHWQKRNRR